MPSPRVRNLTSEDMDRALGLLDEAIADSDLLMSVAPLRFLSLGGMLAVKVFQNRESTRDIDVLIDPNVDAVSEYRQEIFRVFSVVAERGRYEEDWCNDELRLFIGRERRLDLFFESINQGLVVYEGQNLIIWAGVLEFALERKLRRLNDETRRIRATDISDSIALVHSMRGEHPLSIQYIRSLDRNRMGLLVADRSIAEVADGYIKKYRQQGIVEMVWDADRQCSKYADLQQNWVYVDS
ncbi:hypothetical protein GGR53DRAFT_302605 [Hypoxylon sp. FL1150]|nr:hypothetical protein GGR53DRAFT_302605 [Hypoxylon sp. FL1150]